MEVVYKYPLSTRTSQTEVEMPSGAKVLRVDVQRNEIQLWAMVEPEAPKETRVFEVFGTGHKMDTAKRVFINTFFVHDGEFVFHAFERLSQ